VEAFLEHWASAGVRLVPLEGGRVTIGRASSNTIQLGEDQKVSRLHAVLERYPAGWSLRDLGSSNGTFVNGERLSSEHRLRVGDEIKVGGTRLVFREQEVEEVDQTLSAGDGPPEVTKRERDVLLALCRPIVGGGSFAQPATIREMADELVVSDAAIKFHLSNLYVKFDIFETGLSRRALLANEAVRRGAVTVAELQRRNREQATERR
jgi:pSer/pThr/pTyr-binding forkhead associated (FHA) protein